MRRLVSVGPFLALLLGLPVGLHGQVPADLAQSAPRGEMSLLRRGRAGDVEARAWRLEPRPLLVSSVLQDVGSGSPEPADVMGGFLAGVGLGALVGGPLAWIGYEAMKTGAQEDVGALIGILAFGGTGYVLGSATGVWWFENRRQGPRSLWGPMLGSLAGAVAAGGVAAACVDRSCEGFIIPVALVLPPVGALAGYFMTQVRGGGEG